MEVLNSRVLLTPAEHDVSVAFYRDTLGLAIYREFPGGTVFFLGQGFLEVVGDGGGQVGPHVSLWLQVRDLPGTLAGLRARGVPVSREAAREAWGLDEAWIHDPDGTRIVLVEIPAEHPLRSDQRG